MVGIQYSLNAFVSFYTHKKFQNTHILLYLFQVFDYNCNVENIDYNESTVCGFYNNPFCLGIDFIFNIIYTETQDLWILSYYMVKRQNEYPIFLKSMKASKTKISLDFECHLIGHKH